MTKSNYNLKYLYRVVYNDGTIYDQNINDISINNSTKSCYNDLKLNDIHYFTLSNGIHSYTLDLKDGGFSINGSGKFYLNVEPMIDFKLIHYRRVIMDINENTKHYTINFVLGYEAKSINQETITKHIIIK